MNNISKRKWLSALYKIFKKVKMTCKKSKALIHYKIWNHLHPLSVQVIKPKPTENMTEEINNAKRKYFYKDMVYERRTRKGFV